MRFGSRNVLVVALIAAGGMLSVRAASAPQTVDLSGKPAGANAMGLGVLHPLLSVHPSGGNPVIVIHDGQNPAAYGAGGNAGIINGSIGSGGIADIGDPAQGFSVNSKKQQYEFTFAPGVLVQSFSVRMVDWGDLMRFGSNPNHKYAMEMTAYDAGGNVVDTDDIGFTALLPDTGDIRTSVEFGPMSGPTGGAGDATTAAGNPGNFTFHVAASNIARVTLRPRDPASEDPNMALSDLSFELQDTDGDGIADINDHCPNSDLRAFVDTGDGPTTVPNTVDDEGCSF